MPWLALPYEMSQAGGVGYVRSAVREASGQAQGKMATLCGVSSVPHAAVFELATGKMLTKNGRLDISSKDNGPNGAPLVASYLSASKVLQKWEASQHVWRPADAACAVTPPHIPSLHRPRDRVATVICNRLRAFAGRARG